MEDSPLSHYQWLASNDGAHALALAMSMRESKLTDLKIGEFLRHTLTPERAAIILTQIDLRTRARDKFTHADQLIFTRAGLEQATSEHIARYRAARFHPFDHVVDLCCGIGGDLMALGQEVERVTAVDLDPVHLFLADHNATSLSPDVGVDTILGDVRETTLLHTDAVFIDPARRTGQGRRLGNQSEPPIEWALNLADGAAGVGIKTAPGFPRELVPEHWEMEMISLRNDLKEAVLWSPTLATTSRRATVISGNDVHTLTAHAGEDVAVRAVRAGDWLMDVNPSVTNAGLVQDLGRQIHAERIDEEIGFLVSDQQIDSPFGNSWRVIDVLPWHEKHIKQAIRTNDIGPIDIRRRGLAGDVDAITKRLRGQGNRRAIIAMTRSQGVPTAIICDVP